MTAQSAPDPEPQPEIGRDAARPTSYDVARLSGVSQSTVSRVFRDGAPVSKAARKKVEAAARTLNYAPSQIARSLITQRSNMIAVVITDPSNRAYPDILFHLGQEIQATGNRMLVFALPSEAEAEAALTGVLGYRVDGIISSAMLGDTFLAPCHRARVPVVLFNRTPASALASAVSCDHATGIEGLVRHLQTAVLGHVALLAGPEWSPVSRARIGAATAALHHVGCPVAPVVHSDYSFAGGRQAAQALLGGRDGPHTIICANDTMALGVMDACRFDLGLSVPGKVSVTGFDDIPQSAWPSHSLTTLRQPVRRMAQTAVRMLMEQIGGGEPSGERRMLPAELMIRGSTRPSCDASEIS